MNFTFVITTYNRSRVLADLLARLEDQTDGDFEVVVAMDGCTDHTQTMLERAAPPFPLRWIDTGCSGYGLAVARNAGILAASNGLVAILDDDSFPQQGYVEALKRSARAGVITGGPRYPADASDERMSWKMKELGKLPPVTPMPIRQIRRQWPSAYLIENNICLLRKDFVDMGMFSERLKMYGYIGQEFFGRAEFLGLKYQYDPSAAVLHHGEIAGDNGFSVSRKLRETQIAGFLRPSLMRPSQYMAQVAWAKAQADGQDVPQPTFWLHAALALPWRAARLAARSARRGVRQLLMGR